MKTLCTCTLDMKPSSGCLRAGGYIIGGLLMFKAALFTTMCGLGLVGTLVVREVALPALSNLPKFDICAPAFAIRPPGQTGDGCTSSEDILKTINMALSSTDVLNILVIILSVGLVAGLLQISFLSVLLHGLTARRVRLVKIFCIYYAVVIGLGAIATIVLSFMGAVVIVSFYWIPLFLNLLGLLVINSHRKELLAKDSFEFVKV